MNERLGGTEDVIGEEQVRPLGRVRDQAFSRTVPRKSGPCGAAGVKSRGSPKPTFASATAWARSASAVDQHLEYLIHLPARAEQQVAALLHRIDRIWVLTGAPPLLLQIQSKGETRAINPTLVELAQTPSGSPDQRNRKLPPGDSL